MSRTRAWVYVGFVVLLLVGGILGVTLSGVAGDEPPPRPVPQKLDAALLGLLAAGTAQAQAAPAWVGNGYDYEIVRRQDEYLPLYTDETGRTYVDVVINTDGSEEGLEELGVLVEGIVGTVVAARVPVDSFGGLTSLVNVRSVQVARQLQTSNDVSVPATGATAFRNQTGLGGSGTIVAVAPLILP